MKKLFRLRKDLIPLGLILLFALIVWRHIPSTIFQGEGFIYFGQIERVNYKSLFYLNNYLPPYGSELLAREGMAFLEYYFEDRIYLYMGFELVYMLFTSAILYLTVKKATESRVAAIFSTLIFSSGYIGNANMFGGGGYQYFMQRGLLLAPLLFAFLLLVLYVKRGFLIYYFLSLALFLFTVILGFFASWFVVVFIFYQFSILIVNFKKGWKLYLMVFLTPIPFLIGNYLIVKNHPTSPSGSMVQLLNDLWQAGIVNGIGQQLLVMTSPLFWKIPPLYFETPQLGVYRDLFIAFLSVIREAYFFRFDNILAFELINALVYLFAFVVIWKLQPRWRSLALASITTLITILAINFAFNRKEVVESFGSSRYFYYPSSMFSLFWGLFAAAIFLTNRQFIKKSFFLLLLLWLVANFYAIQRFNDEDWWRHQSNKDVISEIKYLSPMLKEEPFTIIIIGPLSGGGIEFIHRYYAHPNTRFLYDNVTPPSVQELDKYRVDPNKLYVFIFDYQKKVLNNKTDEYRDKLVKFQKESDRFESKGSL